MGRHEGRRANPAPGPGAGGHPAVGTAPVPTGSTAIPPTTPAPVDAPAPTAEAVLALVNEVCGIYAQAKAARATAGYLGAEAERAHVLARAAHWDTLVSDRYRALVTAVQAVLPEAARVERFMPVRPLANGDVELHAHDTKARRLVVLLTGVQALAVGAHLTAYAAISLDRIGQKLDGGLPLVKAAPPFTATATTAADQPTGAAGPPTPQP